MKNRPVWAEIDLKAIKHNLSQVRKLVGFEKKIMAVVKANAYGHGACEVGKACLEAGAERLAVAILNEAVELRESGFNCPIMVLGWTPPDDYQRAIENEIILTIYNFREAQKLNEECQQLNKKISIHLKIDTGMTRIGLVADQENINIVKNIAKLPNLFVEGIYTHLAKADEADKSYAYWQLGRFQDFVNRLENKENVLIPLKHAANSASIIDLPEVHLDLVRPGIMLYGLQPSSEVNISNIELKPALTLKAQVSRVEKFPVGTKISYGGIFIAQRETIVATLPIGYADGYTRLLTGKAEVSYKNNRFPVIGKICMDQCMVDITDEPHVQPGDEFILMGNGKNNSVTVDEIASKLGTINYEIVCMLSNRVPRLYIY